MQACAAASPNLWMQLTAKASFPVQAVMMSQASQSIQAGKPWSPPPDASITLHSCNPHLLPVPAKACSEAAAFLTAWSSSHLRMRFSCLFLLGSMPWNLQRERAGQLGI